MYLPLTLGTRQAIGIAAKNLHLTHAQLMNFIFGWVPKYIL